MKATWRTFAAVILLAAACESAFAQAGSGAALAEARRLYDDLKYEEAVRVLDPLISAWQAVSVPDADARAQLAAALELRARSRFAAGDPDGARADFTALLQLSPSYSLPDRVNPRILAMFDALRSRFVGQIRLKATPADAEVDIDGRAIALDPGGTTIALLAGAHTITAKRRGYRPGVENISVAAGGVQDLAIDLTRVSAVLTLGTSPAGVEVVLDGVTRGHTVAGPLPGAFAEWPARLAVPADAVSSPFVIDDLTTGKHTLELRRDCHAKVTETVEIKDLGEIIAGPFLLERTVGSLTVASTAGPAVVYLDGEKKGTSPVTIADVCAGSHAVELRAGYGRYRENVVLKAGDNATVRGAAKPVIALLDVVGLPEGYRGSDILATVERFFAQSRRLTLTAMSPDRVRQALAAEGVSAGWLSFDPWRRPIARVAAALTATGRQAASTRLANALDAQAVAELTVRPDGGGYYLAVLAAGSCEPDVFDVTPDQPSSVAAAMARLDRDLRMYRPSVGLALADVADESGPVVIGVDAAGGAAKAGVTPGDEIVVAGTEPVKDVASFVAILRNQRSDGRLTVEVKDRAGASRRVELQVSMKPSLIAMADQSWAWNALLLFLRSALAAQPDGSDAAVVRLNVVVSLMRLGNYSEALEEIGRVQLPPGPGISNGTVQYLTGLCCEAMGDKASADRAFRAASAMEGQLTEDGPTVRELAARKLAKSTDW